MSQASAKNFALRIQREMQCEDLFEVTTVPTSEIRLNPGRVR